MPTYLIHGGHVLSMDGDVGDHPCGDVLVHDGVIVAVGEDLDAGDADVIDASRMVVLPGFVEVHWHMWNSIWRGLSHDAPSYFALHRLAEFFTPADHYAAVRYAASEAVSAGITTCHDWANGLRDHVDAEAEAQALVDSGIRARFGYGNLTSPSRPGLVAEDLVSLQAWIDRHAEGLMDLGVVCHAQPTFAAEVNLARSLGLKSIAPHVDLSGDLDLLGPDMIFTHGPGVPDGFMALLAQRKVKIGLCPMTDPLIGAGLPPLVQFLSNGVAFEDIGFSVDVSCQTGVDPFAAMRTIMQSARIAQKKGASFNEIIFSPGDPDDATNGLMMPRSVLQLATINGARVLGLDEKIGSLTPGKRADVIMVRTDDLNMLAAPNTNPTFQLVQHGQPVNVDTVMVDGRILKRGGQLVGVDIAAIAADTVRAQRDIRSQAGMPTLDITF